MVKQTQSPSLRLDREMDDASAMQQVPSTDSWTTISNVTPLHQSQLEPDWQIHRLKNTRQHRQGSRSTARDGVSALEIEEIRTTESESSWGKRLSWLRHPRWRTRSSAPEDGLEYHAGEAVFRNASLESNSDTNSRSSVTGIARGHIPYDMPDKSPSIPIPLAQQSSFRRIASWITRSSHNDESDLADFTDAEWTPPDSSYGAAFPVGGWIPKNIRRLIEWTVIGMVVVGIVLFVITTSIRIATSGGYSLDLDDDRYIPEYPQNDVYRSYYDDKVYSATDNDNTATDEDQYNSNTGDDNSAGNYGNNGDDNMYGYSSYGSNGGGNSYGNYRNYNNDGGYRVRYF